MDASVQTKDADTADVVDKAGVFAAAPPPPEQQQQQPQPHQQQQKPFLPLRVVTQLLTFGVLVVLGAIALHQDAPHRGFFCNDEDIALPYIEKTIPIPVLMCVSVLCPALVITVLELLFAAVRMTQPEGRTEKINKIKLGNYRIPQVAVDMYVHLGALGFALVSCWMLTDTLKKTVGSLRPHFLDVCQPNWKLIACKAAETGEYIYVPDAHCTGEEERIFEARRSFPSGHSSLSMCGLLFAAVYVHSRLRWNMEKTAPININKIHKSKKRFLIEFIYYFVYAAAPVVQVLLILGALYIGAVRVVNHYHHVRDVCAGTLIGVFTALHAAFFVINMKG